MTWVKEIEFESPTKFYDSPTHRDLKDNFNTDSTKHNKSRDIVRTWSCKFGKKKRGFDCPVKSKTVMNGVKIEVYRLDGAEHKHEKIEDNRKNFNFVPEVEQKIRELVGLNVECRKIRKSLIENGHFTEENAPAEKVLYNKIYQIRQKMNLTRKTSG